jgi:hypothetical protein
MWIEMVEIKSQKLGLIAVLACITARAFDSLWCLSLSSAATIRSDLPLRPQSTGDDLFDIAAFNPGV